MARGVGVSITARPSPGTISAISARFVGFGAGLLFAATGSDGEVGAALAPRGAAEEDGAMALDSVPGCTPAVTSLAAGATAVVAAEFPSADGGEGSATEGLLSAGVLRGAVAVVSTEFLASSRSGCGLAGEPAVDPAWSAVAGFAVAVTPGKGRK